MASEFMSFEDWKKTVELGNINPSQKELKALYANAKDTFEKETDLKALYAKHILKGAAQVRTIPEINRLIRETMGNDALGDEAERTRQSKRRERGRDIPNVVGDYFPDCAGAGGAGGAPEACGWPIIDSDGDGNDCLIHSFLTATCPNFRRLALHHKRQFARSFRVDFLPKFPEIQRHFDTVDDRGITGRERFMEERFLGDEDLQVIRRIFNVNIVVFQGQRKVGRVVNPAMVTSMIENPEDFKVYFIFNNGTNHFESIKPGDVYFLPIDAATVSIEPFIRQAGNETKPHCDYEIGETVTYQGKRYTISSRKWGDADKNGIVRCITLELLGEDGQHLPNVPVSKLPKKRAHNNAALAAGPGPNTTRRLKPNNTAAQKRPHNDDFVERMADKFKIKDREYIKSLFTKGGQKTAAQVEDILNRGLVVYLTKTFSLDTETAEQIAEASEYTLDTAVAMARATQEGGTQRRKRLRFTRKASKA